MERSGTARQPQLLGQKKDKFWLTVGLCALTAALFFLPFYIIDGGFFHYAGDFNSQQISFYRYMNGFIKGAGYPDSAFTSVHNTFSWATDLGSGVMNAYSFYLYGSPFFWFSLLFPQVAALPHGTAAGAQVCRGGRRCVPVSAPLRQKYRLRRAGSLSVYLLRLYGIQCVLQPLCRCGGAVPVSAVVAGRGPLQRPPQLVCVLGGGEPCQQLLLLHRSGGVSGHLLHLQAQHKGLPSHCKKFGLLAFESLLGVAMGSILLVPAVLSILQNPRTIDLSSGWGFLTYSKVQQYLAILVSWIMPPDSPYLTSIWSEGVIKWTSMSAYLPLCSLAGAVAYWKAKCGDSKKRIVGTCAVFALVPILNSAFYALNSSYYARWYYMPVLVLAAMTVNALEDHNTDLDSPARGISWLMIATVAFAVVPVQDSDTGSWSFGVLKNPGQYCAVLGFGLLGLLLYRYLCQKWRGDSRFAQRLTAAVLAFAFLFSVVHIGIGKFGQWYTDSDLVKQDTNALLLKNDLPEGDYRIDTYKIHDNIGMWLDKSCLQYFGSTAAPSILSFYPALGVKRDVRSEPELSNYALRGLLSVEYLITTPEKQTDFENEADDGWEYAFAKDGYAVYRNTNYVPMGFAYDYYLTQTEYEETAKATRANLLMRALVLTDEDAAVYGKYLTHLPEGRREELYYESYVQDCRERRATAASVFQMNNSGFHAEITLEKENLVFFSVPYDDGFTAYVNGQEADIVEVDEGLMAVLCPAGENSIDFVYQPDGIRLSRALTLGGIVVWLAYTAYFVWRKRRTKRA